MLRKAWLAEQALVAGDSAKPSEHVQAVREGAPPASDANQGTPAPASLATPTQAQARADTHDPFDPMRFAAQMRRFYTGMTDDEIMYRIPWPRLLGYKREADRMIEEENAAIKARAGGASAGQSTYDGKPVDEATANARLREMVSQPDVYTGPTAPVQWRADEE